MNPLEWPAAITALVGSYLLGHRLLTRRVRLLGFGCYLVSNLLWIVWALHVKAWALLLMQTGFLFTSCRGILNAARDTGHPPPAQP